jgi:hypothetical protein
MCSDPEICKGTTHCEDCEATDPLMILMDFGIGPYEFWGARGSHHDWTWVTQCCEAGLVNCWGEPCVYEPPEGPEKEWEGE